MNACHGLLLNFLAEGKRPRLLEGCLCRNGLYGIPRCMSLHLELHRLDGYLFMKSFLLRHVIAQFRLDMGGAFLLWESGRFDLRALLLTGSVGFGDFGS